MGHTTPFVRHRKPKGDAVPTTNADVLKSFHTGGARNSRSRRQDLTLTGWGDELETHGAITQTPEAPYLSIPCL